MEKSLIIDKRFKRMLDCIAQIHENSAPVAQKAIGKRFELLTDFYNQQECKDIHDFLNAFDRSNLADDLLLFSLVYFNHKFLNFKTGNYFGYEDYNILQAYDFDRLMDPNDIADKVQHTGWRGSGKSTFQQINTIRCMYYATRNTIGILARTMLKSRQILRNLLTEFIAREMIEDESVPTLFAERAENFVIFSRSLKDKERKNIEQTFKSASLSESFSLTNGVTILCYSPDAGGRGANLYNRRLNLAHVDDVEDAGEAGTLTGEAIWNQMVTFMEADTGNPDDRILFSVTGNRVNPEEESIFNRFIATGARDKSYIIRSIPKIDLLNRKSLTIRYDFDHVMRQILGSDRPAEITDNPLHTPDMLLPILEMEFRKLKDLQAIPTWRGLFVDPAFSKKNYSDKIGMIFAYQTQDGKFYFGSKETKARGDEVAKTIVKEIVEHKMPYAFIETGTSESLLRGNIQEELNKMNINTVVFDEEAAPRTMSKEDRIKDAFPFFDPKYMSFIEEMTEPLLKQIISFDPYLLKQKAKKRGYDALDAFAWALIYISRGSNKLYLRPIGRTSVICCHLL